MSKIDFTPCQDKVLKFDGNNLLVSASAGSGKTTVIIEKIAREIKDKKVNLDELLVVTFTEAAALEMRTRLYEQLSELAADDLYVASQLDMLPTCDISTLHSYCQKLIKQYFFATRLNPAFSVLDEEQSKALKTKVLDKLILDEAKSGDADFFALSETFLKSRNFDSLKQSINNIHSFSKSLSDRTEFLNKTALQCFDVDLNKNPACSVINDKALNTAKYYAKKFSDLSQQCKTQGSEKIGPLADGCLTALLQIKGNFETNFNLINNLQLPQTPTGKAADAEGGLKEEYKKLKSNLTFAIKDIQKLYGSDNLQEIKDRLAGAKSIAQKFIKMLIEFDKKYDDAKSSKNMLDFNDLEDYVLKILDDRVLRASLQKKYKYIYVDEYQDINGVQEAILSRITNGKNMIMVGDVKQSIYGFRSSSPQIFIDKSLTYDGIAGEVLSLNENFRSNKAILNFVNEIFNKIMTPEISQIDYKNENQFSPAAEYEIYDLPAVNIDIINQTKEDDDADEENLAPKTVYDLTEDANEKNVLTQAQKEAIIVARHIKTLTDGTKYCYDLKKKDKYKIDFGDITILCRDRTYLKEFSEELLKFNIPLIASSNENIFDNHEIKLLFSFLKIINNGNDDISLVICLTSIFVGVSFDELALIKLSDPKTKYYAACAAYAQNNKNELAKKLNRFYEIINKAKQILSYGNIYNVLCYLDNEYNILNYYLALPDGRRRHKLMLDYINSFVSSIYNNDLFKYINYANNTSIQATQTSAADENSVKINTMHSSKGLEFKIVFIVGTGKKFSTQSAREEISKSSSLGLGLNYYDLQTRQKHITVAKKGIDVKVKMQEFLEEMRLLYVALTRAKNHLYIVGAMSLQKLNEDTPVFENNTHLKLISNCFSGLTKSALINNKTYVQKLEDGKGEFTLNVYSDEDLTASYEKPQIVFDEKKTDKKLQTEIESYLGKQYAHTDSVTIAQKNSVTSLMNTNANEYENFNPEPKRLTVGEGIREDINSAKLGSCYHTVMQYIDFKTCDKTALESLINKLISKKLIDERLADKLERQSILTAVKKINALGFKILHKEKQFLMCVPYNSLITTSTVNDKVILQGVIDLILQDGDKLIIVDFKTSKANSPDQLVGRYKLQLDMYKKATEKALNQKVDRVYIYSFHLNKLIIIN